MRRFDPTGRLASFASTAVVIAEDAFETGTAGWTQLLTPDSDRAGGHRPGAPRNRADESH
jgi:hypothetical protein